jgi:hypothetical protein
MKNLTDVRWIDLKGVLFLLLGLLSAAFLFFEHPTLSAGFLIVVAVWSFCRFYYFAFYVIEHYVDPSYRFSGLLSFALYLIQKERTHGLACEARSWFVANRQSCSQYPKFAIIPRQAGLECDYLGDYRRDVSRLYHYSYSNLDIVFSQVMSEGWLTEADLVGLQSDKIWDIKRGAESSRQMCDDRNESKL